ncbi:MAG: DMT family transporter [Gemmobacter sp.]
MSRITQPGLARQGTLPGMTIASPLSPPRAVLTANLICALSMLIWAAGLAAGDILIPHIPPLPLAALRAGTAALVLLPVWWLVEGTAPFRSARWDRALVVGGIGIGIGALLLVYAQSKTDAVTVAVISAATPVVGIALECLLDGRRMTMRMVAGLGLSVAGGILALDWSRGGLSLGLGAAAAFGAVLAFTWASRATVTAFPGMTALGRTTVTITGGAVVAVLAAGLGVIFDAPATDWAALGWPEMGALLLFGIGSLAVSQTLWIMGVGRLGIGLASLHMNTASFYVMLIVFLAGGLWDWQRAFGAGVVVLGVLVAQGRRR